MLDLRETLKNIKHHPEIHYIIHYSCQSLYDDNETLSPRITSIAVLHLSTNQTISFSAHAAAEELGIQRDDVSSRYDEIERKIISEFYKFARDRRDKIWLHWNMKSITYGFEHIAHRYRTLTQEDPPSIPVERRVNIDEIYKLKYGDGFVDKPRMRCLMDLNGGRHRDFLTGEEEVEAFKNRQYIRMHNSTLCKVNFFAETLSLCLTGRLKTKSSRLAHKIDRIYESQISRIGGSIAAIVGLISGAASLIQMALSK